MPGGGRWLGLGRGHGAEVLLPVLEHLDVLGRHHLRLGRGALPPSVLMEGGPPHVDGEDGEDRPFEDVAPTQFVPAQRPPHLEPEGPDAQSQRQGQGEVELDGLRPGQARSPRDQIGRVRWIHALHPMPGAGRRPPQVTTKATGPLALPPGVTTVTGPLVPRLCTVTTTADGESETIAAFRPLMRTFLAPANPLPDTVTSAPTPPDAGVIEVTTGTGAKDLALAAVPPGVWTVIGPGEAPARTMATTEEIESANTRAGTPLKATPVAPERLVPVMTTPWPTAPAVNLVMVGAATVKAWALVAVPDGVVTVTEPLLAPGGTEATTAKGPSLDTPAATPWKATWMTPDRLVPAMVTPWPTAAVTGKIEVMVGMKWSTGAVCTQPPAPPLA